MIYSSPIEFEFTLEPGMSDSEIKSLWEKTQLAQSAMDDFLFGRMSEFELTDYLGWANIDVVSTRDTLEDNLTFMGIKFSQQ
jgi:hypothetical protein